MVKYGNLYRMFKHGAFHGTLTSIIFVMPIIAKQHQLTRVLGTTVAHNDRSIRLLEKLGLTFERNFFMEGDPEELCLYGMELTNE